MYSKRLMLRNKCFFLCFTMALLFCSGPASAVTLEKRLDSPIQESRATELFKQIRCVSCAGESVYESRGRLAKDFRKVIRAKIAVGEEDNEILHYFTERYGQEVLALPLPASHKMLWAAPLLFVLTGIAIALVIIRRRPKS